MSTSFRSSAEADFEGDDRYRIDGRACIQDEIGDMDQHCVKGRNDGEGQL